MKSLKEAFRDLIAKKMRILDGSQTMIRMDFEYRHLLIALDRMGKDQNLNCHRLGSGEPSEASALLNH